MCCYGYRTVHYDRYSTEYDDRYGTVRVAIGTVWYIMTDMCSTVYDDRYSTLAVCIAIGTGTVHNDRYSMVYDDKYSTVYDDRCSTVYDDRYSTVSLKSPF